MSYAADRAVARSAGADPEAVPIPAEMGPPPSGVSYDTVAPEILARVAAEAVIADRKLRAEAKAKKPSIPYTKALGERIAAQLEEGLSLSKICEAPGMPHKSTVNRWAHDDKHPFSRQYAPARARGYRIHADEIMDIADEETTDPVQVARNRLRIDTRKWVLAKMMPKIYGDKIEIAADPEAPFTVIETIIVQPPGQKQP